MKLARKWTGEYWYDGADVGFSLPRVAFTADFSKSLCGGFRGQILDDSAVGMPYRASVRGRLRADSLSFRKIYSGAPYTVASPSGAESFDDYCKRLFGSPPALIFLHPPIYYFGRYSKVSKAFEGIWTILSEVIPLADGRFFCGIRGQRGGL